MLDDVLAGWETVRVADRTTATDADRLSWFEKLVEAERRVSALKTVLIGEADEAGSAMRAVHTPLQDWLARSGQNSPRQAIGAVWRARELEQRRCLRFGPEIDGSIDFSGNLPVVDGRRLQQLVQAIADRGYRAAKDTRNRAALSETSQQRLSDALVAVISAAEAVETSSGAGSGGGRSEVRVPSGAAQLMVVVPYAELLDRTTARGVLMDGTSVSPGELRRLACSADVIPVVLDGGSMIVDVGRAHRLAPPPLRLAVAVRDGGCAFPGCTVPIWHCDVHHIIPWQESGPTNVGNVVALCRTHHGLIEPAPPLRLPDGTLERVDQWQVRIDGRGLPEFLPPAAADAARTPIRKAAGHVQELLDTG